MKSGIYKITNTTNGKFYIGSSKDIEERWNCHKQYLRGNYHINPKLQHAWNKYGENKFIFEIMEETNSTQELLFDRENHYITLLKPYEREIGYNICVKAEGGDTLKNHPSGSFIINKWKEKYSKMYSGEGNPMYGKHHTKEAIQQQKEKAKGRYTLEWFIERFGEEKGKSEFEKRRQMLINRNINYSYDNKLTGTKRGPMSEEIKKRISEGKAHLKLIRADLHKDILSNNFTIFQMEEKYGISKTTILREKRKLK